MTLNVETVLVVEDDPVSLMAVALYLKRLGFAVEMAATGEAAMAFLHDEPCRIDWLFTDIQLPGEFSGWDVGRAFRIRHPARPVVYATAAGQVPKHEQVAGSVFIPKPFRPHQVIEAFIQLSNDRDRARRDFDKAAS